MHDPRRAADGRRAARKHNRVVQVAAHRRSSRLYADLVSRVTGGSTRQSDGRSDLSAQQHVSQGHRRKLRPVIRRHSASSGTAVAHGPRKPARPFQVTIAPYKFRWWDAYSSQIEANWGVHYLDAIRWALGEEAPASISGAWRPFCHQDDDRTIPDTLEAVFEFASGRLAVFGQYEASSNPAIRSGEIEPRRYARHCLSAERSSRFIVKSGPDSLKRRCPARRAGPREQSRRRSHVGTRTELPRLHRHRETDRMLDVETGHRSTTFAHLANLALATCCLPRLGHPRRPNASPITRPPTTCSITNIANPGGRCSRAESRRINTQFTDLSTGLRRGRPFSVSPAFLEPRQTCIDTVSGLIPSRLGFRDSETVFPKTRQA